MNKVFTILTFIATLSAYSYTISVESSEISFEKISIGEDIQFDAVKLENGVVLPVAPGEPLLPAISVSVALPEGMAIDFIEVVYSDPVVLPGEYDIMPAQTPIPIGSKPAPFVKPDAEIYSMKTVYPGVDYITFASGNMSGYYMGNILVAPVQYIPASGEIVLYREIDFDPVFFGARGDTVYPRYRLDWIDSEMQRNLAANVINPEDISTPAGTTLIGYEDSSLDLYPYLIICPSSIATTAQDLAFWKTKKGLCAEVITTEFIDSNYSGVDIEEKTRNCIIDYFENQGTQYVCLITNDEPSSTGYIPMRVATIPKHLLGFPHDVPTDNYYGCLDGDWNADDDEFWGEANDEVDLLYDIFVGRLYAEDASDLANVINKTLCYEGTELSSEVNPYDYQDDVLLAGAIPDDSTDCWDISEYIQDEYMVSSYWDITGLHGVPFSTGVFINAANADKGFIGHAGHAEWDGIQSNTGGFEDQNDITKDHLYGLDNGPRYSGFLYSVGCQSADIDHFDNCASSFLRSPDGGGVGYIGNTREGRYTSGDILHSFSPLFEEEYFRQLCKPEAMGKGGLNVFKSGQTHAYHKNSLVSYIDEDVSYRWIYYTLYLTGDPDIWVHNDTVRPIYVAHQSQINQGQQNFSVTVSDGTGPVPCALVCLWKDDEVYCTRITSLLGKANFPINPTSSGTMYITA
ncbi:MAG: hypothetical protein GY771_02970, partial [bacterium]|nr:hypothetical protein [bacterium]